jgi:hypothetical protein
MGTRIHAVLSHALPDIGGAAAPLNLTASEQAVAVRDYWKSADPHYLARTEVDLWSAEPVSLRSPALRRYVGPGSLYLTVTPTAALIGAGGAVS